MCIDYKSVNSATKKDAFPIPNIEQILSSFSGKKYFTSMDLRSGYYQIPLAERSKPITAFAVPRGFYQFRVLPFGLTNAVSAFQRFMTSIFRELDFVNVYVDDILIASSTC